MGWQWHQLDHMQIICTSLQTDNHSGTSSLSFFYKPDALSDNQLKVSKQARNLVFIVCVVVGLNVTYMLHVL